MRPKPSLRKWLLLFVVVIIAAVWLLHAPLLRGLAGLLIVDQPTDKYDCIAMTAWGQGPDGDRCYDAAAELWRQKSACGILLLSPKLNRIEQIGATPPFEAICRRELAARGVPDESISIIHSNRYDYRATARSLAAWLSNHPGKTVLLLGEQFRTAQIRNALDAVLDPADAARVFIKAMPNREFDDANWWTRRCGFRMFGSCWLLRFQDWLYGDRTTLMPERNADDYQRHCLQNLTERTP